MGRRVELEETAAARAAFGASHEQGAMIVREGEGESGLYVVLSGRVVLSRGRQGAHKNQPLRIIGAGEMFGLVAALTDAPSDVTARAVEAVEILHVPRERLAELF